MSGSLDQRNTGLGVAAKSCRWTCHDETGRHRVMAASDDRRSRQAGGKIKVKV